MVPIGRRESHSPQYPQIKFSLRDQGKILHLLPWDEKFVPSFIQFIRQNFTAKQHVFFVYGSPSATTIAGSPGVVCHENLLRNLPDVLVELRAAKKVIIHGLFSSHLLYALALSPKVLPNSYWAIWGGDLYVHNANTKDWRWRKNERLRRFVISRIGHFITHVRGDYHLAQQWYGASGKWHQCFMYPSNIYKDFQARARPHLGTNILLGNSATPTNNHLEAIEKIKPFASKDVRIYCPLSYGDSKYANRIEEAGRAELGDKFVALKEWMAPEAYAQLLADIDIAVFNHNRQQGMGNIVALLGLGKTVYARSDTTSWAALVRLGVKMRDVDEFDLVCLSKGDATRNTRIVKSFFSESNLRSQWAGVFSENGGRDGVPQRD